MAEAIISAIVGEMVSRAISLLTGRFGKQPSMEAKLRKICHMVIKIHSVVEEAQGRQITNRGTLDWLSEFIHAMHRGRYLLDTIRCDEQEHEIEVEDDHGDRLATTSLFNPAKRVRLAASCIVKSLQRRHGEIDAVLESLQGYSHGEIDSVLEDLQRICSDLSEFIMLLQSCPPMRKPLSTNLYADCHMFGRHVERERIIRFLLHKNDVPAATATRELDILPVIGDAGVGKTTLVQHVCDDERVRSHFSLIALFDSFSLSAVASSSETRVVLHSKHATGGDLRYFSGSLHELKHKLHSRRFLMVLENVGPHKRLMLQVLLSALGCGNQGSKIIVTGDGNGIARIGTVQPIKLRKLPHPEYWFYFKAIAFAGAPDLEENCPRLVKVGQAIARRLNGSFFGAKVIGPLLRAHPNLQFWCKALRSSALELPVLRGSLNYIADVAGYFLSGHLAMCYVRAYTSCPDSTGRTLSVLENVCAANAEIGCGDLVVDRGNSLNLHVLLCKSVLPSYSLHYVAHCHLGTEGGCQGRTQKKIIGGVDLNGSRPKFTV